MIRDPSYSRRAPHPDWNEPDEDDLPRRGCNPNATRGDCDCCGKSVPLSTLTHCWVTGIETYACRECTGDEGAYDDDE